MTKLADISIAEAIATAALNATDAMSAADGFVEGDQDWENEKTTWSFEDGSKLAVSGNEWYFV